MLAIQGIYDGVAIKPNEKIPFTEEYEVVITFLKPKDKIENEYDDVSERLAMAESLFGILPSTITDDEVKAERLKKYECNY